MANLKAKAVGDAIVTLQEINEEIRQRLVCLSAENLDETDAFVLEVIQTLVQIEDVSTVVRHHLMVLDEAIKEISYKKEYLEEKYKEDMDKVEKLILPLLYNLMKNPEKDYIFWPNREEIINKQIARIQDITRDM